MQRKKRSDETTPPSPLGLSRELSRYFYEGEDEGEVGIRGGM